MPIDPNIYGSIRPAAPSDPMQTLAQVSQLQNMQMQRAEAQQRIGINQAAEDRLRQSATLADQKRQEELKDAEDKRQEDADLSAYLSSGQTIDPNKVYEITHRHPERGTTILQGLEAYKKVVAGNMQDARTTTAQLIGGVLVAPPDKQQDYWTAARNAGINAGMDADSVPEKFDPHYAAVLQRSVLTPQQQIEADKPKVVGTHVLSPDYKTEIANYPAPDKPSDFESYLIGPYARSIGKTFANKDAAYAGLTDKEVEQAREKYRLDQQTPVSIQLTQKDTDAFSKLPYEIQNTFGMATSRLNPKMRQEAMQDINRAMTEGRTPDVNARIISAALDSESPTDRAVINARSDIKASMQSIAQALQSIPQGLMGATVEETMRKLGGSSDPAMARVKAQIESSLAQYRHGMTGAAFGEAEAARYEKQFPNYRNQPVVNIALMQGFLDDINVRDKAYWERKLGPAGAALVGAINPVDITKPSTGSAAPAGGNPFRK